MFSGSAPNSGGEGNDWKAAQVAFATSENDKGSYQVRERDEIPSRPGMGSRMKSAEQLPPLSSILFHDSGSRISLPSLSRGSNAVPSFAPASPRSTQRPSVARFQHQYWDESSCPRPVSEPSNQFAYTRAPHSSTTSELPPPPPRPQHGQSKPSSPCYYDLTRNQPQETPHERAQTSSTPWPPRTEQRYHDQYQSAATSPYEHPSVAREPAEQRSRVLQSVSSSRECDNAQHRSEMTPLQSSGRSEQQTSNSKSAKASTSKETLGPKIWTGTHFLPRFVRQAEVLGEGMCYFYDDGTYCKTVIDDEPVNAHWGVTKAGKPRKRLAIACITCREKKIKCDPEYPRCVQCEKFGRVCKFKNA